MNHLSEVASLFLRLGAVAFGGPPAHIGMMEAEAVHRRQWVDPERFAEGVAVCQALPGPASTQLAIWLGTVRAGWMGGLVAGVCFILPAFVLLLILSALDVRYGAIPSAQTLLYGVKAATIAIVLSTSWRMAKTAVKDMFGGVILAGALALSILRIDLVWILLGAGLLGLLRYSWKPRAAPAALFAPILILAAGTGQLAQLAWFFLKAGAFLYGGGFVIVAFIEREVVGTHGWLTRREFLDGVALGQITPGPVLITATFIGYKVAGLAGAIVATIAMFLPSFVFIFVAAPNLARWRSAPRFQAFLKGVNPAVVGALFAAAWSLGYGAPHTPGAIRDLPTLLILLASLVALMRYKIAVPIVLLAAAVIGAAARLALHI